MARPSVVRSMRQELIEGATDGTVKKLNGPMRTDLGFDITEETRMGLFNGQNGFGINPSPEAIKRNAVSGVIEQ